MQQLITKDTARKILGGRTPHLPVEYETAVKALAECITLDEAKYWDNKADALAAWAKIYHSSEAERKAKMLKLHAYRRMGQLAEELRPTKRGRVAGSLRNQLGARSLLVENGFTVTQAAAALGMSKVPEHVFNEQLGRQSPNSPGRVSIISRARLNPEASKAHLELLYKTNQFRSFLGYCRGHSARDVASGLTAAEAAYYHKSAQEMIEWLDEFERCLPK